MAISVGLTYQRASEAEEKRHLEDLALRKRYVPSSDRWRPEMFQGCGQTQGVWGSIHRQLTHYGLCLVTGEEKRQAQRTVDSSFQPFVLEVSALTAAVEQIPPVGESMVLLTGVVTGRSTNAEPDGVQAYHARLGYPQ